MTTGRHKNKLEALLSKSVTKEDLQDMVNKGYDRKEIAEKLGCKEEYIYTLSRKLHTIDEHKSFLMSIRVKNKPNNPSHIPVPLGEKFFRKKENCLDYKSCNPVLVMGGNGNLKRTEHWYGNRLVKTEYPNGEVIAHTKFKEIEMEL